MSVTNDPDFAPIATRIRDSVGRQGFMSHVGAELSELTRGGCTLAVDRRPELLQQHGLFHGGVTAFLVDNATTIAAATSRGQAALTAEYKLNLLSPATGERLICRARVIKPGRQSLSSRQTCFASLTVSRSTPQRRWLRSRCSMKRRPLESQTRPDGRV